MKINPMNDTPLYQQVAEDLRSSITSGERSVGGRLPPHRELARIYGVSLMTINKAMAALVSEGTISSRVGRGSFVARVPAGAGAGPMRSSALAVPERPRTMPGSSRSPIGFP